MREADQRQAGEAMQDPLADERAIVDAGQARFTVLTAGLIRLEWSARERFEDRASQFAVNRRLPLVGFDVRQAGPTLVVETEALEIRYEADGKPFHEGNLAIRRRDWTRGRYWSPGDEPRGNLRGTARTLDDVSGATRLGLGVLSRDGWAVVNDKLSLVFDPDYETGWLTPRADDEAVDLYFFGHGLDYAGALLDFTRVAGRIPLPPRYVFGAWWSRYWPYTDESLMNIVRGFDEHAVPLDVLVIDMDWHLEGWTGYTWNPEMFPDPREFLCRCHGRGLRVTLNLHPAEGVTRHEAMFDAFCRAVGEDPAVAWHVPFDCGDPTYMKAYFEVLHHPLEKQGVDFWWLDWQQGDASGVAGLDPLWQLNHLHWRDMETNAARAGRRPLVFSRWGGLGNHRYPVGFSGDTHSDWRSLAFQPHFTATAGNVGYGYWSHDIGGHYPGRVDAELYLRWIQFGAFSPVLRTHTTKHADAERRIWEFPAVFEAAREAFRLRYRLLPYIYSAAARAYETGVSMCRPLYYEWAEIDEAYARPGQYMLGDDLLVAPVTSPVDPETRTAGVEIWLPPGGWRDFFTGELHEGDRVIVRDVGLDEIPVYAKAGAIVPMAPEIWRTSELPADPLLLRVFEAAAGQGELYEDDGETVEYQTGAFAITRFRQERMGPGRHAIDVEPVEGTYKGMPGRRSYRMELMGFGPPPESVDSTESTDSAVFEVESGGATLIRVAPRSVYTPLRLEIERAC